MLCRFRPARRARALARLSGQPTGRVEAILTPQLLVELDLGRMMPAELLDRVRTGLNWGGDYQTLARAWSAAFEPDEQVLAIARRVNVPRGLLTDNGPPLADTFRSCLPEVASLIRTAVFASDIATTKPSPGAYRAACELLGAEPARVLFIDDKPTNVDGARATGLNAVRYTTPEQLRDDLTSFNVLDPE